MEARGEPSDARDCTGGPAYWRRDRAAGAGVAVPARAPRVAELMYPSRSCAVLSVCKTDKSLRGSKARTSPYHIG
jgi:hypothetical protein